MNALDIILLFSIALGAYLGYKRGLIDQLSFGFGIAFAILQSSALLPGFTEFVDDLTGMGTSASMVLGFILMLVASILAFKLVAKILTTILNALSLNWLNRIAGALFAAYLAILLLSVVVNITGTILSPNNPFTGRTAQSESLFYKGSVETASKIADEVIR